MQSRAKTLFLSVLSLAAAAALPARAAFSTARFEITFPAGWQPLTVPGMDLGDSVLSVFNMELSAYSWMSVSITDHPLTAEELEAYRKAYAGSDSVTKVTDGSKTLGGMSFTFVEYKAVDTSDGEGYARIYYTSSGNQLFTCLLSYDPAAGAGAVTGLETALATLKLKGTPIRARAPRVSLARNPADHDILGRMRPLAARTVLFRLPAP
jgi:hypothetical protein